MQKLPDQPIAYPDRVAGENVYDLDRNLQALLARRAPDLAERHGARLSDFGAWVGEALEAQAAYSDRHAPPRLEAYGPEGEPRSRVILNSDYVTCHQEAYRRGAVGLAYGPEAAPHLLSFAMGYLLSQADISIHCPVTMTGALAHVLARHAPAALSASYLPELTRMDGASASGGTWATELHGGSDVGATTTEAVPDGEAWRLTGLKWFASNAGCGLALATARPRGAPDGGAGLGCYLVPATLPDGSENAIRVRRLKDKLGTRALPTGEIELDGAWALEVAGPPAGLKVMLEALGYSRIHNAVAGCAVQRRALLESLCWAYRREAFGRRLTEFPMVRDSLLDLTAELEASCALAFEAGLAFDAALADESRRPWLRLVTALAKERTATQGVEAARQSLELVGGNGYTEDWPSARLYRDAMVLPVWEGPGNIQALELLRVTIGKEPGDRLLLERIDAILESLPEALGDAADGLARARADSAAALAFLRAAPGEAPRHARRLLDLLADTLSAALLLEEAAADLAEGDHRKAIVARRYLARRLGPRAAISDAPDPAHAVFERIVGYAACGPG
ncbi:MAG TPA: acyl-CoA dehydrogenase family protein [Kiloniellales bacterium]|nr:acyl-CoA dehydrogenase family protein [Kiloniellales bacterium]